MKYRIFDLKYSVEEEERFIRGAREILREGFLTNHTHVEKFEKLFKEHQGSSHAIALSNGTTAIETALRALNVAGKKVFLPSNTFIATATATIAAGTTPVILDLEPDWFGLCPKKLAHALDLTPRDEIGAIICVHIGGHIAPSFLSIVELCKQRQIPLVEDCAQSHFATLNDIHAGNFGDAGTFSFFTTKTMTTGEGGMLVCQRDSIALAAKQIRRFGMDLESTTSHIRDGGNFKLNEFAALLGEIELGRVEKRIAKRRELAKIYQDQLDPALFQTLGDPPNGRNTHYKQIVISKKGQREDLSNWLQKRGIPLTGGVYYQPLHQQPSLQQFINHNDYTNSNYFSAHHFCPPCYPELNASDILDICHELNHWGRQ